MALSFAPPQILPLTPRPSTDGRPLLEDRGQSAPGFLARFSQALTKSATDGSAMSAAFACCRAPAKK